MIYECKKINIELKKNMRKRKEGDKGDFQSSCIVSLYECKVKYIGKHFRLTKKSIT